MTMNSRDIARRATRGTLLLAGRNGIVQLAQIGSSLIVARLIAPEAYGTFAIALTAIAFARYIGDLGVANSFLALPELPRAKLHAGALIATLSGLACTIALLLAAPLLADLLDGPSYAETLIRVLACTILIDTARFGATVTLSRGLRFGPIGVASLAETLVLYAVQIGLLLSGVGIWALVAAQIARSVFGAAFLIRAGGWVSPRRLAPLRPILRRALPFQGPAMLGGALGFVLPVILSAILAAEGVGFWAWATVLSAPITGIVIVISGVSLPSLVRLRQHDPGAVREAASLMMRASILVPAAASAVLLGLAPAIVPLVFGARWDPAVGAVVCNLVGIVPATFSYFLAAVLESEQRAGIRLAAGAVAAAVGIPALVLFANTWGVTGAAAATAVLVPAVDVAVLAVFARVPMVRAVVDAAALFVVCGAVSIGLEQLVHSVAGLALALAVAAPVAIAGVWLTDRHAVRAVLRYGVRLPAWLGARLGMPDAEARPS